MKKLIFIAMMALTAILTLPLDAWGQSTQQPVKTLLRKTPSKNEEPQKEDFLYRHRLPSAPLFCTIDCDGTVDIAGIDASDINTYEIWDEGGETCLWSFTTAAEFADTLFSLSGDYTIVFVGEEYELIGNVSLTAN